VATLREGAHLQVLLHLLSTALSALPPESRHRTTGLTSDVPGGDHGEAGEV